MNKTSLSDLLVVKDHMSLAEQDLELLIPETFKKSLLNKFDYELVELFNDTNNSAKHREIIIDEFNRRKDPLLLTECISNLNSRYIDSATSLNSVKKLILEICNNKTIGFPLRIMAIQSFEIPKKNVSKKENNSFLINLYINILEQNIKFLPPSFGTYLKKLSSFQKKIKKILKII